MNKPAAQPAQGRPFSEDGMDHLPPHVADYIRALEAEVATYKQFVTDIGVKNIGLLAEVEALRQWANTLARVGRGFLGQPDQPFVIDLAAADRLERELQDYALYAAQKAREPSTFAP